MVAAVSLWEGGFVRLSRHIALCLMLLLPCAAHADDIGPDQAQALQRQLKAWLTGLLGPSVPLSDMPWQITGVPFRPARRPGYQRK